MSEPTVDTLYGWIGTDRDGKPGLLMAPTAVGVLALVTSNKELASTRMRALAQRCATERGTTAHLVVFHRRDDEPPLITLQP